MVTSGTKKNAVANSFHENGPSLPYSLRKNLRRQVMIIAAMHSITNMLSVDGDDDGKLARTAIMAMIARMTKNLLISRPKISSSSLGARQKMIESRRKVKVRFTF